MMMTGCVVYIWYSMGGSNSDDWRRRQLIS